MTNMPIANSQCVAIRVLAHHQMHLKFLSRHL